MKKIFATILCLVMILCLAACGNTTDAKTEAPTEAKTETVYKVKFATVPAEQTAEVCSDTAWAYALTEYLEEHSGGRLVVEFYPGGQLGGQSEYVTSASEAAIEAALINMSVLNAYDPNLMALQIPGLYSNEEEATAILNSEYANKLYSKVETEQNITLAGIYCNGFRSFTTNGIELKSVEDIKGYSFRVMDDPMYVAMVEALGAIPTPMAATEMYTAMQNGVVDGHENTIANVLGDLTYEVQDYMILDNHTASIAVGIVSTKFLESLPEDLQVILLEGMQYAADIAYETVTNINNEGIATLREKGMTIYIPTEEELAEWQAIELSATEKYVREQIGDEAVDGVKAEIEAYRGK